MADPFYDRRVPGVAGRLRATVARWLFPVACLGCGRELSGEEALHLCAACRARLRPPAPAGTESGPAGLSILSLWRYEPPLDGVILALKFRRLDYLGRHLARVLAAALGDRLSGAEVVVPVPLHWTRRVARGFDQAERIAVPLAERLGLPVERSLARRRPTRAQARLGRAARRGNLSDAFRVVRPAGVAGRRVLLVDDVATTGATLEAAAEALSAAGAAEVLAVTVARTVL